MLEIKNLTFSYDTNNQVLQDINAAFNEGEVIAIQGKSGQGKSTLLSILSGLENDFEGELIYQNQIINKKQLFDYNIKNISMIFQDLNLINYLSIKDNIKQGYIIKDKKVNEQDLQDYLKMFNLEELDINKMPSSLSGGQQQRIAIIRALLANTSIILADEPTSSVDKQNSTIIIDELKKLAKEQNKIVIIVTHDEAVAKMCDQTYLLDGGKLVLN